MIKKKASEYNQQLLQLPLVTEYQSYKNWKGTFLGKKILYVQQQLENPTDPKSRENLRKLSNELGALLQDQ